MCQMALFIILYKGKYIYTENEHNNVKIQKKSDRKTVKRLKAKIITITTTFLR